MANPSLKNGYISVATELVEQFALHSIPSSEMRIIWVVWRKTWGWTQGDRKKDWDWISLSQFAKMTSIKKSNIPKLLKSLVCKRILLRKENRLKFNQNYEEWAVYKRSTPVYKRSTGVIQTYTKKVIQTHTNNRYKDTNTIDKNTASPSDARIPLVIEMFKEVNPSYKRLFGSPPQRNAVSRMLEEHGQDKLTSIITYLPKSNSARYAPTITTPSQLEQKLGDLIAWSQKQKDIKKTIVV